jgi:fatty acid desaturase
VPSNRVGAARQVFDPRLVAPWCYESTGRALAAELEAAVTASGIKSSAVASDCQWNFVNTWTFARSFVVTDRTARRRRYRPPHQIRTRVNKIINESRDNWHSIAALTWIYCLIGLAISLPFAFTSEAAWWTTYLLVSLPAIGCWQRALATVLHESSQPHQSFARNPTWNFICGTFLSGYTILQGWTAYSQSHLSHHLFLGDDERDPDKQFQNSEGTYQESSSVKFTLKYVLLPCIMGRVPAKIRDLIVNRLVPRIGTFMQRLEQAMCIAWFLTMISVFVWAGYGLMILLFWIVPLITTFPIVGHFIELAEHFPFCRQPGDELLMSRNRWTDSVSQFFTGQLNEHLHQTHHLFPTCPWWALPQIHEVLMEDSVYRESQLRDVGWVFPILRGIPSILGHIVSSSTKPPTDTNNT